MAVIKVVRKGVSDRFITEVKEVTICEEEGLPALWMQTKDGIETRPIDEGTVSIFLCNDEGKTIERIYRNY